MIDRLAEASLSELEVLLDSLLLNAATTPTATPGVFTGRDPVLGCLVISEGQDRSSLRLLICRALVASVRFHTDKPPWAPGLPLRQDEIEAFENDDDNRINLVGYYAGSLRGEDWSPDHPGFAAFASGLLALRYAPDYLRKDHSLREEFPPRRLAGLCGGRLYWRSSETFATERMLDRMVAEHEARVAAGLATGP